MLDLWLFILKVIACENSIINKRKNVTIITTMSFKSIIVISYTDIMMIKHNYLYSQGLRKIEGLACIDRVPHLNLKEC